MRESLEKQVKFFEEQLKDLDGILNSLLKKFGSLRENVKLLQTIPGVGRIVALTLLAEIPLLTLFSRARDVAAFAGLTPGAKTSGTSVCRKGGMTREGSNLLRKALYMAALNVARRDNGLRASYDGLVNRGKEKKIALVATMHKIVRIAYGVLTSGEGFDPKKLTVQQ